MMAPALTVEDAMAAARCVALWQRAGRRPARVARQIMKAAQRARRHRAEKGEFHPVLGDGSVMVAALRLRPDIGRLSKPVTTIELLRALGPVCFVLGKGAS